MQYSVLVLPSAERELRRLPTEVSRRIMNVLESLADEPQPAGVQKLQGTGDRYRVRQGDD